MLPVGFTEWVSLFSLNASVGLINFRLSEVRIIDFTFRFGIVDFG